MVFGKQISPRNQAKSFSKAQTEGPLDPHLTQSFLTNRNKHFTNKISFIENQMLESTLNLTTNSPDENQ